MDSPRIGRGRDIPCNACHARTLVPSTGEERGSSVMWMFGSLHMIINKVFVFSKNFTSPPQFWRIISQGNNNHDCKIIVHIDIIFIDQGIFLNWFCILNYDAYWIMHVINIYNLDSIVQRKHCFGTNSKTIHKGHMISYYVSVKAACSG